MFQPAVDKIMIRQRLNVPAEKVIMFTVRNLVRRMGLENLILALKAVVETAPDIYLVLAGEGPLKDDLISLVKQLALENFVEFTGFIPEDLIPDYYRMADLFVLPTLELEGFGLVTLESMASGVPVLGTPVGGTLEILSKFDHEFIFKDMRAESIADLIIKNYWRIKEDPDVWNEISNKCCEFVKRNYSWEKNVASLEKVFMT
jgi:glycosyltransferase involved in cell wall biosynthesis